MENFGTVLCVKNNLAEIKITRASACGENCAACGLCKNREMIITVPCSDDLMPGDIVKLTSPDKKIVINSMFGYVTLTLLLILGGVMGALLGGEWLSFLLSVLFVLCGVFVMKMFFKKDTQILIEKITR